MNTLQIAYKNGSCSIETLSRDFSVKYFADEGEIHIDTKHGYTKIEESQLKWVCVNMPNGENSFYVYHEEWQKYK